MVVTSAKRRDRQFMAFPSTYSDLRIVEYCLVLAKGIMRELNSIEVSIVLYRFLVVSATLAGMAQFRKLSLAQNIIPLLLLAKMSKLL